MVIRFPWRLGASLLTLALLLPMAIQPAQAQEVTPARVANAVAQLDGIAEDVMRRTGIPGMAIAVVYRDEVLYAKGFGVRQTGTAGAVDADTVFQLASVSKPVASTVMAALVGDGVIAWDDPVVKHDPGFKMYEAWVTPNVTLADMFSHRSGLPDHAGDLLEDLGFSREEVLYRLRFLPPEYSFRAGYRYTNFGMTQAGVAAAKTAGLSWEDLSARRLYQPLGMSSTSSKFADYVNSPNRAYTHVKDGDSYVARYVREPEAQSPAGGVSSTARDMAQFMRLQLADGKHNGRQIVASEPLADTHRPQAAIYPYVGDPSTQRQGFYGYGWNVSYDAMGRVRLSHSGAFALGAGTAINLMPADELGIVTLTNAAPIGAAEAVNFAFLDLATTGRIQTDYLTVFGPFFAAMEESPYGTTYDGPPPANPRPALAPSAYVGRYFNDFWGDVDIVERPGGLAMVIGPLRAAFPLRHWDGNVFTFQPVGENAYGPSGLTLTIGPSGQAVSFLADYLNKAGVGTLVRRS
jgi:CubicO group peptidase (beta-lactamase class C family)